MTFRKLHLHEEGGIATIRLAAPEKLNVLSRELLAELSDALDQVRALDARVLILTAEGRAFSSGGDLSDPQTRNGELGALLEQAYHPVMRKLLAMPMPVICGVNGMAVGGACGMILACDIVIAAEQSSFVFAFANIGLVPDCGVGWLLPRIVGRMRAREWLLLGRTVSAQEALMTGMVGEVVDAAQLPAALDGLAGRIADGSKLALMLCKRSLSLADEETLDEALATERKQQDLAGKSADFAEALQAMEHRRPANFRRRSLSR